MSKNTVSGAILMLAACAVLTLVVAASAGVGQNTNNGNTGGGGNANHRSMNSGRASSSENQGSTNSNHGSMKMTSDQKFATEAAVGGMAEVQLGQLAAQKGATDEVRQFGQRMVDDHTKANQDLMQVASGKGLTLPAALDAKHQAEVQKLSALSGDKFDKEYVSLMVKDHKKDVSEFQKESTSGADADIKSFASRTLPTLQEHLQMIQRIHDKAALRKNGNLTNANSGGGMSSNSNRGSNSNMSDMGTGSNSNMGGMGSNSNMSNMNMGSNSNSGMGGMNSNANSNSNRGKGKGNKNSNRGSNSNGNGNSNSNR